MGSDPRISNDGSSVYNGITVNTPYEKETDKGVKVEDFLQLMVAQLSNQDFMNPVDDTQYVTQLAQFATMQSMQELSHYSQTNYVTGLVGKTVTVASFGVGGSVNKETGLVTSVNLSGDKYTISVNGKQFELSQIMSIADSNNVVTKNDIEEANKMQVIVKEQTDKSISIRWDAPVQDEDVASELRYDVYISKDGSLDHNKLSDVKKGEKVADGLSTTEFDITGLESGTTYFVNVVVRNKNGDEAVYQHAVRITK